MTTTENVCLMLADLSGYTEYVAASEPEHAPSMAGDLVEAVVRSFGDLPSHADRRFHRRSEIVGGEERQVARPPRTTGKRPADDVRQ